MDGLRSARHADGIPQLRKGHVGIVPDKPPEVFLMLRSQFRLRPGKAMSRGDVAGASSLLQKLLDHALGHVVARRDLRARTIPTVISSQNPLPQIDGKCLHAPFIAQEPSCGYRIN